LPILSVKIAPRILGKYIVTIRRSFFFETVFGLVPEQDCRRAGGKFWLRGQAMTFACPPVLAKKSRFARFPGKSRT
jgi:hypothetical protein